MQRLTWAAFSRVKFHTSAGAALPMPTTLVYYSQCGLFNLREGETRRFEIRELRCGLRIQRKEKRGTLGAWRLAHAQAG